MSATAQQFDFDIAPGEIRGRLEQFASFTDTQILYDAQLSGTTRGVHGRYTVDEALMVLLRGTGLLCERSPGRPEISVHVARHHQQRSRTCLGSPESAQPDSGPPVPEANQDLEEIGVYARRRLGTHLRHEPQIGSSLLTWNEEQIRILGAQVIPDVLDVTQNFQGGPTQDTHYGSAEAAANSGLGTGANLRGVGSRSTLVLYNGHPVAPSGNDASFADLLQFPLSAVTKVSVMPDGASGIYGSEAVGGVIEIDTVNHYSRPESRAEIGTVTDGHRQKYLFSQEIGTSWDGGSALGIADFMRWGALPASARGQANTARVPYTNPGNLETTLGTFPIPAGQSGQPLDFSTLVPASPRLTDPALLADTLPSQKRWAFYGFLDHELTPSMTLWCSALWTERDGRESLGGQEVYLNVAQSPFLLHAPPDPIFEEYNLLDDFGPQIAAVNVRTLNASVELHAQLPGDWQLVLSGSDSLETETQVTTGQVDRHALQAAVSNPKQTDAFNPLGDGTNTDSAILTNLNVPKRFGSRSQLWSYRVLADGPVPGADRLRGAVGFEARDQRFAWALSQPPTANDLRRRLYAAFAEVKVPVLDTNTLVAPLRNLVVSLAGRFERYSDFGHSATPRVGLRWAPITHIALRGAWARSVRAPDLGNLSERTNGSLAQTVSDTPALFWSGGNPHLTVERALTRTVGLGVDSEDSLPQRLTLDLSYFDIVSKGRIEQQQTLPQDILTNPLYSSFVTRNPDPALQQYVCNNTTFIGGTRETCLQLPIGALIDLRLHNAGTLWTDGIDTKVGISADSAIGSWGLDVADTYILHYRQATLPTGPLISYLNTESHPLALHVRGAATWTLGGARVDATMRYANGYHNNETQPVTHVGSWTTADLRVAYTFGEGNSATAHPTEVAVFVKNLFDKYPPFSNDLIARVGYDEENGDLSGREITLSVHKKW